MDATLSRWKLALGRQLHVAIGHEPTIISNFSSVFSNVLQSRLLSFQPRLRFSNASHIESALRHRLPIETNAAISFQRQVVPYINGDGFIKAISILSIYKISLALLFPFLCTMSKHNVGIFPASGGIGGSTVKHIANRLPAKNLTLIARSPEKLEEHRVSGATVRKADYDDDASLEHAFDGVDTLFLISYASVEHHHRSEVRYRPNSRLQTPLT